MKNNTLFKVIMSVCTVLLIAGVVLSAKTVIGYAGFAGGDGYTAGNATISQNIKNLDIDWTSGMINIDYHKENTVIIEETSKKEIRPDRQMRWKIDGDTLQIRYEKSGFHMFGLFSSASKNLTVTLPEETVLDTARISATSGTVFIPSLSTDRLSLDITSGDIDATVQARSISTEMTSGKMTLSSKGTAEEIHAGATSGDISILAENAGLLDITATSGQVTVQTDSFDELNIDVTSGDVMAMLPSEPGFTGKFDVTSGKIEFDLPMEKSGDTYICGDGSGKAKIDATSGNITVIGLSE